MQSTDSEPTDPVPSGDVTALLQRSREGDSSAFEKVLPLVYAQLRAIAAAQMRGESSGHTLQPTALVHEAYLRLADADSARKASNRTHFIAIAARAMRQILVDHARGRLAAKRGGGAAQITLDDELQLGARDGGTQVEILDFDRALNELAELHERQARVIELRFIAGMTIEETAEALRVHTDTVVVDTLVARRWLKRRLHGA